jgi:hypothetical protein
MARNVRKMRVLLRMTRPGQGPIDGTVFLGSRSAPGGSAGTLSELLNRGDRFIPFHRSEDGSTLLVARRQLQWVACEADADSALVVPPSTGILREELVLVRFADGTEARGLLLMELPNEQSRASDYMNSGVDFFPLSTPAGLLLVNKHAVVDALVYETSPMPALPEPCAI